MNTLDSITVRLATSDDRAAVARLADRDTRPAPAEPRLVAERDGEIQAVLSLVDGSVVADPFRGTADLVELLRCQARLLRWPSENRRRRRVVLRTPPRRLDPRPARGCA